MLLRNSTLRTRVSLLAAVSSLSVVVFSCQHKEEPTPEPIASSNNRKVDQQELTALEQAFLQLGQEKSLQQKLVGSPTLNWFPKWASAFRVGAHVYVPMRFTIAGHKETQAMLGAKRFLVLPVSALNKREAQIVVYAFDKQGEAERVDDSPAFLDSFTGKRISHQLVTGTSRFDEYMHGELRNAPRLKAKAALPKQAGANTSNIQVCTTRYECVWESNCERGIGQTYNNYATTYSEDGCGDAPTQEACGPDNWGMSWHNVGYYSSQYCQDYQDPTEAPYLVDGVYSMQYGSEGVLEVPNSSMNNDEPILPGVYANGANQKWNFQIAFISGGERVYRINAVHSGKAMSNFFFGQYYLRQWDVEPNNQHQNWVIEKDTDTGEYYFVNNGARVFMLNRRGSWTLIPR